MNNPATNTFAVISQMSDEELREIGLARVSALEVTITKILHKIGVPAHIKGYQYVRTAISLCVQNPNILDSVTKKLYPAVAKIHNTTNTRTERAIRHAIEVAWDRCNWEAKDEIFGNTIAVNADKPTNSEFIAMIADKIRMNMLEI